MVEVWPYAERSRGIAVFQLFGRLAGFFTTFVNPIGINDVGWRYLISYCCWLAYEVVFVYFFFPETFGRTLEELAFSTSLQPRPIYPSNRSLTKASQCSRTSTSPTRPSAPSRRRCITTVLAATTRAWITSSPRPRSRTSSKMLRAQKQNETGSGRSVCVYVWEDLK